MKNFILFLLILSIQNGFSQNVGIGTMSPNPSAALEIKDSTRGILIPRMTMVKRLSIANPAEGLMVYQTDSSKGYWGFINNNWVHINLSAGTSIGQMQYWNGSSWVNVNPGSNGQSLIFCNGVPQWGPCESTVANLPSVTIGTQIWTTKNLDVRTYRNGDVIPQVTDATQWANLTTGAWCWYNNDSATYAAIYGRLYNWYAVNDPRGLAPQGWHVPSDVDWTTQAIYLTFLFGVDNVGDEMNGGGTNASGFAGLPGGSRGDDGTFDKAGQYGFWWSSTERDTANAWSRYLHYYYDIYASLGRSYHYTKSFGFSVRLVRD